MTLYLNIEDLEKMQNLIKKSGHGLIAVDICDESCRKSSCPECNANSCTCKSTVVDPTSFSSQMTEEEDQANKEAWNFVNKEGDLALLYAEKKNLEIALMEVEIKLRKLE